MGEDRRNDDRDRMQTQWIGRRVWMKVHPPTANKGLRTKPREERRAQDRKMGGTMRIGQWTHGLAWLVCTPRTNSPGSENFTFTKVTNKLN
jgi:hypothetical protein